eukprot:gnl/Spiro4/14811_TR7985_c0_g1_i1.p1 gnl/Spiro4/14811_TR7985_c0_g1~~gnl/Spiro4/14811_TR7985_c0_g1_i1.p1  ORF type:complete len:328 (+),score=101.94 gnl/Spiro4/14811_TR7985_c0_g1_i1:46-984(+)
MFGRLAAVSLAFVSRKFSVFASEQSQQPQQLDTQLAGHDGSKGGGFMKIPGKILKPVNQTGGRSQAEVDFYAMLEANGGDELVHRNIACRSYGVQTFDGNRFLLIDDITAGYSKPCLVDLKIGTQTYDEALTGAARDERAAKDAKTTTTSCGYRICGMRVWDPVLASFVKFDRAWGAKLTQYNLRQGLLRFFLVSGPSGERTVRLPPQKTELLSGSEELNKIVYYRPDAVREVCSEIARINEYMKTQRRFRFYSASVLVVYEGDPSLPPRAAARLIDFAHVFPIKDGGVDAGFLFGMNTLLTHLTWIGNSIF